MSARTVQYGMLTPALVLLCAFIFVPSLYIGWLSFNESSFGQDAQWVGLDNWLKLLGDRFFWKAFLNTFIVVNLIVYGELFLGVGIAVLFAGGIPFRRFFVAMMLLPYAISEVAAVVMWKYMLEPEVGVVSWLLSSLGLGNVQWTISAFDAFGLVTVLSIWLHLPFTFIILYTSLLGIPKDLYEAARIDGGSSWQIFRRITLPLLMPAILIAMLFRYIFAFRLFSEVWLLTGGGPARQTEVMGVYLYRAAFRYHEFGLASATGWAMVILSFLIALWYLRIIYKRMFAS